jgi:hypothetical protein
MLIGMILLAMALWLGTGLVVALLFGGVARLGASSSDVLQLGSHDDCEHDFGVKLAEPQLTRPATG